MGLCVLDLLYRHATIRKKSATSWTSAASSKSMLRSLLQSPRDFEEAGEARFIRSIDPRGGRDTPPETELPSGNFWSPRPTSAKRGRPKAHWDMMQTSPPGNSPRHSGGSISSSDPESDPGTETVPVSPAHRRKHQSQQSLGQSSVQSSGKSSQTWAQDPITPGSSYDFGSGETTPRASLSPLALKKQSLGQQQPSPRQAQKGVGVASEGQGLERALTQSELESSPKHKEIQRQWNHPSSWPLQRLDKGKGVVDQGPAPHLPMQLELDEPARLSKGAKGGSKKARAGSGPGAHESGTSLSKLCPCCLSGPVGATAA